MVDAFSASQPQAAGRVWAVGPLMRAVADTLAARFNPVAVRGEISGFSRAASGHCYFALKDETGQVRCALFRRSAEQLTFSREMANSWKPAASSTCTVREANSS